MKKYAILREFFPWNLFAPPISEKFLAMSVPHMKPPKSLWRDKGLDVTTHEIESYDGGKITCFVLSPKKLPAKAPCLIYLHGGGFVLEAAGYHYANAMRYAKEVGCKVVFPQYRLAPQHPFPAFFEDCYASFCWAYNHAEELEIDFQRIGIGGLYIRRDLQRQRIGGLQFRRNALLHKEGARNIHDRPEHQRESQRDQRHVAQHQLPTDGKARFTYR